MARLGSHGRVLVVDDNELNRELLTQDLEDEGFGVVAVGSGKACLESMATVEPEVILLDIEMPVMDGIETCRQLKQNPNTQHVPVVFLTAKRTDDEVVVEALAAGGNDFLAKPYSLPILRARVLCQVAICRAHAKLRALAMTDELTGLFSRRFLMDSLRQTIKTVSRTGPDCVGCLLVDVDHFKAINDTHGHAKGDAVLREIAASIEASTRGTDLVARFGGEEFVVVLPQTDSDGARVAAEKIRVAVEAQCAPVTVSVGVSVLRDVDWAAAADGPRIEAAMAALLRHSDAALYDAKGAGRNRVAVRDLPPGDLESEAETQDAANEPGKDR